MKKKILILAGGFSKEKEISLKTAKGVFNQIKKKYNVKIIEPNGHLIKNIRLFTNENKLIFEAILSKLKSREKLVLNDLNIDNQIVDRIFKFASIKHIF